MLKGNPPKQNFCIQGSSLILKSNYHGKPQVCSSDTDVALSSFRDSLVHCTNICCLWTGTLSGPGNKWWAKPRAEELAGGSKKKCKIANVACAIQRDIGGPGDSVLWSRKSFPEKLTWRMVRSYQAEERDLHMQRPCGGSSRTEKLLEDVRPYIALWVLWKCSEFVLRALRPEMERSRPVLQFKTIASPRLWLRRQSGCCRGQDDRWLPGWWRQLPAPGKRSGNDIGSESA